MKKILTFLLLGGCILSLQGCINFSDSEGNSPTKVERITEGDEDFNEDDYITGYYPTLAEAIKHNTLADGKPIDFELVKTIKIIEDEESCIFYGTLFQADDSGEFFAVMRFRTKDKDGKKEYSNPLSYGPLPTEFIDSKLHKNDSVIEEQNMFLNLYSSTYATKTLKNHPNFVWSLSAKKEVQKIKVNNQKPTEVIPFKVEKVQLYFYYFDDLKNNTKDDEFVITIQ
ncbi:hypothetical protein UAY_03358 [Enterococcus moraviensis ATCC BAA-383]|uniref:Lipoprotein n=1 Tax=Enterococcus moraviensis ATCC BAA-383 TaxID=1158609 RepID=R2QHB0_9ENTE|nr:hypothetical protein [Enterococcus moraviensis]EOH95932.1 hypothetical protein UAY_03358 [Enterococcus moraviensis ATCC BAA-383]EOT66419.1 hypothetical protein I586_02690 [Enterococcus moraviensis ATCC BAA-383]OJG67516.1 hypothetical protein RV09_GL002285 [Enterococcus moraviensis]